MEGDKLTLQGRARDALSLLQLLSSSGRFQDVKFESEVIRDQEAGTRHLQHQCDGTSQWLRLE